MANPFLERRTYMDALTDALTAARKGDGRFVAISGEAGIGKSRLVDEFLRRSDAGVDAVVGRAFSATTATPYAVWVDAFEPLLRNLPRRDLVRLAGDVPDVMRLFPSVAAQLDGAARSSYTGDLSPEQTAVFGQMRLLVARLAARSPLVVVLDNLQWADRSSIEMLHFVVRGTTGERVAIVAAYRAEEVLPGGALDACVTSLERLGLAVPITLGALSIDATAKLVARHAGERWPEHAIGDLHRRGQGNPFFVVEIVKHVEAGGRAVRNSLDGALPRSVEQVLGERLTRLDEDPRRVLAIAGVIGTGITYDLLRAVTGFDEERLLAALDELCAYHLLDEFVHGASVTYVFHQPLVQEVMYARLGAARRQFLHRLVATELMQGSDAAADLAFRIARHLVNGTSDANRRDALPYLLEAGRRAVDVFANHEAVALLGSALRIVRAYPELSAERCDLQLRLGEAHKRLGAFAHAIAVWEEALLETSDPRSRATLHRCIGRTLWQTGREDDALTILERGAAELDPAERTREGMFLRQERAQARLRHGQVAAAVGEAHELLTLIDADEAPEIAARLEIVLCTAHGHRGEMRRAGTHGARAIELADHGDVPGAAYLAHYTLASLLRFERDGTAFELHAAACSDIAARMHAPALDSWPLSIRVERATLCGKLDEAVTLGEEAVAIDRFIGQGTVLPRSLAFLSVAQRLVGAREASRRSIRDALELVASLRKTELRTLAIVRGCGAYMKLLDGDYEGAQLEAERLSADIDAGEPLAFYQLYPYVLPLAAEAAARNGDVSAARAHLSRLLTLAHGGLKPAHASAATVAALMAAETGGDAVPDFEKACELWEQVDRPHFRARAMVDLATALGARGDRAAAIESLVAAARLFDEIGAAVDASATSRLVRAWGARVTVGMRRRATGEPVSRRERDIVKLIARGRQNREIAEELTLSELTVETHVRNILRKLGLRSRAQIAALAVTMESDEHAKVVPIARGRF